LAQYGERVWNLTGDMESIAKQAIEKTESFFQSLEVKTRISEYTNTHSELAADIRKRFEERKWLAMGERGAIIPTEVEKIVNSAL